MYAVIPAQAGIQLMKESPRSGLHGFVRYAELLFLLDIGMTNGGPLQETSF
jgi:hypothetical protein